MAPFGTLVARKHDPLSQSRRPCIPSGYGRLDQWSPGRRYSKWSRHLTGGLKNRE